MSFSVSLLFYDGVLYALRDVQMVQGEGTFYEL